MSWRLLNSIDLRMLTAIKRSIFQAVITRPISTLDQKVELEASRLGCKRDKFFYLCAFEIAKRLQRQKGRLREPYSDVIESPSPNDHFSIAPGLLYSVPLACTKFSRDNQFPDDVSLRNWLDIIEEAIATESVHYKQLSKALLALSKMHLISEGQLCHKIGWPLLVRWFSYAYYKLAEEESGARFSHAYRDLCCSAHRMVANANQLEGNAENFAEIGRLTCDLLPRYCDFCFDYINYVPREDLHDPSSQAWTLYGLVDTLRRIESTFHSTKCLLRNDTRQKISKLLLDKSILTKSLSVVRGTENGKRSLKIESNDASGMNQQQLTRCDRANLLLINLANIMERWDVGDSDFWIEFFRNPFKTYDNYIQLPEPFTASLFVILAARVLLHYNIVKLKTNQDILGNILKPFVRSHLAVALQSAPRTEIESLNDKIKNYDSRSRLFLTATDLKWLKECVKSSTFEC